MSNNDLMLQQCLSVLNHVSEQLAQLKRSAEDPLKVIDLVNMSLFTLFHEQKAFVNLAFQLSPEVRNCIKTIDDLIKTLVKLRDHTAMSTIDQRDLYTLVEIAEQMVLACTKPIYESQHAALKAEHGEPMAIAIPPYRPWDDVAPPTSNLPRLIVESLRPKLTLAVKLFSGGSPKDKEE
jgi:hypothetical protein